MRCLIMLCLIQRDTDHEQSRQDRSKLVDPHSEASIPSQSLTLSSQKQFEYLVASHLPPAKEGSFNILTCMERI